MNGNYRVGDSTNILTWHVYSRVEDVAIDILIVRREVVNDL